MSTQLTDEYLPWTADMIRDTHFSTAPGRRQNGLDRDEVGEFVTRVGDEIAWLHGQIENLKAQLAAARTGVELVATGELNVYESLDEQALQIRVAAQAEANKIVAEAGAMADDIVAEANLQADEIVRNAADQAQSIVSEAQQQAGPAVPSDVPSADAELPELLDMYEQIGERITTEVERIEAEASAARERLTRATDGVRRTLLSGGRTPQLSGSPSIPGEHGEPILTPDPPDRITG